MSPSPDEIISIIRVTAAPGATMGWLECGSERFPCALGRSGIVTEKREGDGGTPVGIFPLRQLFYRQDRIAAPVTHLPMTPVSPSDGWCDAPEDSAYNKPVRLPYPASAENMWSEDHLYDLVVVLGHNDNPPIPYAGSAIFFHLAREGDDGILQPTEGCVVLRLTDMESVLRHCGTETMMQIEII